MLIGVFDIGGTSIKYGIVNDKGDIVFSASVPTQANLGGESVIQKVVSISKELKYTMDIEGISVSTAGQINNILGSVVFASDNIPNYTGIKIKEVIEAQTKLPVAVENDVNCAAIGEHWKGNAQGVGDFLCLTIGTGIGGALFLNGTLFTGDNFSAGEVGHITLYPGGMDCTCGNKGCLERYASSQALENIVLKEFGKRIELPTFFELVKSENVLAQSCFNHWVEDLSTGVSTLIHIVNPKLIIIGGGISAQGDFLLDSIKYSISSKVMPNHARNLEIKLAMNGNNANLLGAAKNFLQRIN